MFLIPKLDAKGEDRTTCFQKKHCTGFIKPRLDYIFVSNSLQELVNNTSILTSLSDHSPVHLSLSKENKTQKAHMITCIFVKAERKYLVISFWELLEYEIHKFTIDYTNREAKQRRKQQAHLESQLKKLENNLESSNMKVLKAD